MRARKKPTPTDLFLQTAGRQAPGQRCRCCSHPKIAAALVKWADARAAGGLVSLPSFHTHHLAVLYPGACPSFGSVRGHVVRCLRRHPSNGKRL